MICGVNNSNGNHTVYNDTGTHNYTIVSTSLPNSFINVAFTIKHYESFSFSASNIDIYPVILTNKSTDLGFPFYYLPIFLLI
jgi:hypothetical protein